MNRPKVVIDTNVLRASINRKNAEFLSMKPFEIKNLIR